jgi:hypothetical protein
MFQFSISRLRRLNIEGFQFTTTFAPLVFRKALYNSNKRKKEKTEKSL